MDAFDREISVLVDEMTSPKQRSATLARFAREEIDRVRKENEAAIGAKMRPPRVTVDGAKGKPLTEVRPDGTIIAEFNAETNAVRWLQLELERISPELTGAYVQSHTLFVDGVEFDGEGEIPEAREYVLASDLPYARKIEAGQSKRASKGVYQAIATVAARRFKDEARIRYTFRDIPLRDGGTERQPAIVVRPL